MIGYETMIKFLTKFKHKIVTCKLRFFPVEVNERYYILVPRFLSELEILAVRNGYKAYFRSQGYLHM